jgi:L-ascorbate metabolism protein UlaG (beta-lactamase superfamily)
VNIVANVPNPTVDVMTVVLDFVPSANIAGFAAGITSGGPISPWTSAVINNGGSSIAFTADPGMALKHDASNHLLGQLVFNPGGAPAAGSFVTAQLSGNAGAYNGYGKFGTVPEPATLAMALPGLLPLGLLLRRRRASR